MQSPSTIYTISRPQIIREQFDEEVVIVDLDTGSYYALGGAGGEIWSAIEDGANQSQIVARMTSGYSGDKAEIEAATLRLLSELQEEELITLQEGASQDDASQDGSTLSGSTPKAESQEAESADDKPAFEKPAFEAPILQKFTDMQALLLLDPIHEVDNAGWPQPKPEEPEMIEVDAGQAAPQLRQS